MSKAKISYQVAKGLAEKIVAELAPACERIEVAGSIRRKKAEIGDIELCAIPKLESDLFGNPGASLLDTHLEVLLQQRRIIKGDKWGPNYKKFHPVAAPDLSVDLFITTPPQWGLIFIIRTGSADFSHKLVTPKNQGGLLPSHLRVSGGWLWDGNERLDTPEEMDVFNYLGLEYIEPEKRLKL